MGWGDGPGLGRARAWLLWVLNSVLLHEDPGPPGCILRSSCDVYGERSPGFCSHAPPVWSAEVRFWPQQLRECDQGPKFLARIKGNKSECLSVGVVFCRLDRFQPSLWVFPGTFFPQQD